MEDNPLDLEQLGLSDDGEFHRLVLDSVLTQIAILDSEGTIITVNDAWSKFFCNHDGGGRKLSRPGVGLNYLDVCGADGLYCSGEGTEEMRRNISSTLRGELEHFTLEYPCHLVDRERWFQMTGTRLRSARGGAVISHVEVRHCGVAEREVYQIEEELRALIEASAQLVWTTDAEGEMIVGSPTWQNFTGQTGAEERRHGWISQVHPEDREKTLSDWREGTQSGKSFQLEYRLQHHTRGWRWMSARTVPWLHGDGVTRLWVTMAADITEQRQTRQMIERQAKFLDQANEAILVQDSDGHIVFWNKGAERMYGWTKEEALGQDQFHLTCKFPAVSLRSMVKVRESGEWSGELSKIAKDGREITVESRWTLLPPESEYGQAILCIDLDITTKRALELQYLRAQRMESIGTLAGGIAHDLNNMLSPILMSVELLRNRLPDSRDQELLQTLEEGALRGATMVRQILTFARGVEGRIAPVDSRALIQNVCKILSETSLQQISVRSEVPPDISLVMGDETQLHQVLMNLCLNARDAMPHGGKLIVRATNREVDEHYAAMHLAAKVGHYVLIHVIDTGEGIPEHIRDKIFEPFFTTKEVGKGTGLGLATTSAIVKTHGGFINVHSEVGKGTTFSIYLPAEKGKSFSVLSQPSPALPSGHQELILVVDDEPSIRKVTEQTLKAFNYRVLTATDGAEAVGLFAKHGEEIAAVVTDLMMPIMDGVATIHALRRLQPGVLIIAVSGLGTESQRHAALRAGATHFLQKPYLAATILHLLRELIETRPPAIATPGGTGQAVA